MEIRVNEAIYSDSLKFNIYEETQRSHASAIQTAVSHRRSKLWVHISPVTRVVYGNTYM
jgi:hypothetical protein